MKTYIVKYVKDGVRGFATVLAYNLTQLLNICKGLYGDSFEVI